MALSDWIEVFAVGKWTASNGSTNTWTDDDLHKIANKYNEEYPNRVAPAVLGHPKDNSPAYGWVEKLKVEGGKLLARFRDFQPEFVDWIKRNLYKMRSISLGPDLTLRHVGWLGGVQPAVPGLKEVSLSDGDDVIVFEFANNHTPGNDNPQNQPEDDEHMDPNKPGGGGTAGGSMDDRLGRLENIVTQLAQTVTGLVKTPPASGALANNHASQDDDNSSDDDKRFSKILEQNTQLYARTSKLEHELELSRFREYLNTPEMRRRIAPADRKDKLDNLLMMAEIDREKSFAEGDGKSMVEKYKKDLLRLPELITEDEFATGDRAADNVTGKSTGFTLTDNDAPDLARREKLLKAKEYAVQNNVDLNTAIYTVMREDG